MEEISEGLNSMRMNLRERPKRKTKINKTEEIKIRDDTDPERSNRDKRKNLKRKFNSGCKNSIYDEYGHLRSNGLDICDCMDKKCPGCWNECENCGSAKCGVQCRVNRKFYYECIKFDGKDSVIYNQYLNK